MKLGDRVRDVISGFQGVTTGRSEYINGCRQYLVKPDRLKDSGELIDGVWTDEQNLEVIEPGVLADPFEPAVTVRKSPSKGGPDVRVKQ